MYHATDRVTFDHYPENIRLNQAETMEAEKMISVGSNKKLVKMNLMASRNGKAVSLKALHNVQTKIKINQVVGSGNELQKVYNALTAIPGGRVRFITNESQEILGKCDCLLMK